MALLPLAQDHSPALRQQMGYVPAGLVCAEQVSILEQDIRNHSLPRNWLLLQRLPAIARAPKWLVTSLYLCYTGGVRPL